MDIDGDGDISLKELVNLGKKLNVADAQTKTYKKILFFMMGFMLFFAAGTFLMCLGAVEAGSTSPSFNQRSTGKLALRYTRGRRSLIGGER